MQRIPLTQGQFALVDDEDFERLNQCKWFAMWDKTTKSFYAAHYIKSPEGSAGKYTQEYMHRLILGLGYGDKRIGDHINRTSLDNQRLNLRIVNRSESAQNKRKRSNTSGYIGVTKDGSRWVAYVRKDYVRYSAGHYDCPLEAALARDKKALELHGEFAVLNFTAVLKAA